jgi:YesN/AraC family two-component response regulator
MIIDDEKAVRNILKKTILWESKGMEVVGEAASGIEAINTIDDLRPDIAFVDIHMPFMNGIDFAKMAIKRYPELKIVILTAFDDFSYAKECIGIGVFEYILKPIVKDEIHGVLDRIAVKLDKERLSPTKGNGGESEDNNKKLNPAEQDVIISFINESYQDSEINLRYVANKFGFNASYLSRKFKEKNGMTFVEYLTAVRMVKAEELAKDGELMYITAEKVGIPDPNYFGKCFKKYKGVSYSEVVTIQV